jgi:glycosyltransferase involved in cell wall biosynthesis
VETETPIGKSELIESCHISPQRILAVESGINPEIIDGTDWVGEKVYEACFLARIHRSKGIFDLIEAWAHVCKHRGNAKLAIAGWGTEEVVSSLKEQISKSGLDANVAILGYLSEQEKYRLFKSSRLYVLPSYEEGIPITFYEAMYCGLPVITYYLPTYETIRERIGAVALGDKCALAREIIETLDNEERASRLVELGRDFASRHTWDDVANDIISEIDRLMHWKGY